MYPGLEEATVGESIQDDPMAMGGNVSQQSSMFQPTDEMMGSDMNSSINNNEQKTINTTKNNSQQKMT